MGGRNGPANGSKHTVYAAARRKADDPLGAWSVPRSVFADLGARFER